MNAYIWTERNIELDFFLNIPNPASCAFDLLLYMLCTNCVQKLSQIGDPNFVHPPCKRIIKT